MNTIPKRYDHPAQTASVQITTVTGRADDWFFVQALSVRRVKRAVACLIEPQVGDLVLLCDGGGDQESYILSVLSREQSSHANLCLPGGVTMQTDGKQLAIHADGIELKGRESIGLATTHLDVNAVATTARIAHVQTWLQSLETTAERVTLVASSMTQHIGRMIARVRESWRKVEGLDETQAARMRVHVEGAHQTDAEHVTVNAQGFVRIDGKTINLG